VISETLKIIFNEVMSSFKEPFPRSTVEEIRQGGFVNFHLYTVQFPVSC